MRKTPDMKQAAMQLVEKTGWYIHPLHTPLFVNGRVGCTCEQYKRSVKYKRWLDEQHAIGKHRDKEYDPQFECDTPGKHPRFTAWEDVASNDLTQICEWWERWPAANIGVAAGKSGLLDVDADAYKENYAGAELLTFEEQETTTNLTGNGGSHLVYLMPAGKTYGNKTGDLPDGIDIRGCGGQFVAPPSLHPSGQRYQWEDGFAPWETTPQPLPKKLIAILDKAQSAASTPASFSGEITERPDLSRWNLSEEIREKIEHPAPNRDRSSEDQSVITRLVSVGATDDEILSVFQHYPIGTDGKFSESGERYLAISIGNARKYVAEHPSQQSATGKKIISAAEYKQRVDLDDDEPLHDGLHVIVNGQKLKITACEGMIDGVINYLVEGKSEPLPETKLSVEVDDSPPVDPWVQAVRNLGHKFSLNRLEDMIECNGQRLDEITLSKIYLHMRRYKAAKTYVDDCINLLAAENTYHPIQDYLNSLQWDGKDHLGKFLTHINNGEGDKYIYDGKEYLLYGAILMRWLLGCVARGLDGDKPTAFKHQTPMLVLIGPQGMGKSSLIRWLVSGVGIEYHREGMLDPHNADHIRSAVNKWIWEISELGASLRKGDRDALKSFITQEWHTYRKPWGKGNITKPLLCNFVGTVNPEIGFLDDPTGNRRFLPVNITAINHDYKEKIDVNQLWAQLVHNYRNGYSPELLPEEKAALQETYKDHEVENPLQTYLQMYFTIDAGNEDLKCFTADIITRLQAFGVAIANNPKVAGREINDALAPLKAKRKFLSIDGVKGWGWIGIAPNNRRTPYEDQQEKAARTPRQHAVAVSSTAYAKSVGFE